MDHTTLPSSDMLPSTSSPRHPGPRSVFTTDVCVPLVIKIISHSFSLMCLHKDAIALVVQSIVVEAAPQMMYNLTVAVAHTFFVGDGEWLVHNSCSVAFHFYHGTNSFNASKIRSGIDLSYGRGGLNFDPIGRSGFYVTNDYQQSVDWAKKQAAERGGNPVILEFVVPKSALTALNGKIFTTPNEEWARFVIAGRNGTLRHIYVYVEGPMLRKKSLPTVDLSRGILPLSKGHQVAIYTDAAVILFQSSLLP